MQSDRQIKEETGSKSVEKMDLGSLLHEYQTIPVSLIDFGEQLRQTLDRDALESLASLTPFTGR